MQLLISQTMWRSINTLIISALLSILSPPSLAKDTKITIAAPGPGNLLFLPIDLAKKIGADTAQGVDLEVRYFGGGPQAYQDMLEKNSDFSVGGMAALAEQRASGNPVICIAAISRVPAYSLMVRSDLKDKIKKVSDLKGHIIGVKGHTKGGRSTTQMFTEYMLMRSNIPLGSVNFLPAGQYYVDQHAALESGAVDALMGDEPFASRLKNEGVAIVLADFHDLAAVKKLMGGLFMNAQMATREDVIANNPEAVEKMVKVLRNTLIWINKHSAQEISNALNLKNEEDRLSLKSALSKYKNMYTPDGTFSDEQVKTAEQFFHQVSQDKPAARTLQFDSFINYQWAGGAK